jgi:hypothetical protein
VAITIGFAEDRAMLGFEVDPGNGEPEFFGVTAEPDGDRIANRDPGWQADLAVSPAGTGHKPTAVFGQDTWPPGVTALTASGSSAAAGPKLPKTIKTPAIRTRSDICVRPIEWDGSNLPSPSRPFQRQRPCGLKGDHLSLGSDRPVQLKSEPGRPMTFGNAATADVASDRAGRRRACLAREAVTSRCG